MSPTEPEISVNKGFLPKNIPSKIIKLSSIDYEVNIHIPDSLIESFKKVNPNSWTQNNHAIKAGISAKSDVFWVLDRDENTVYILIGHDDQTWDISIRIQWETFLTITKAL